MLSGKGPLVSKVKRLIIRLCTREFDVLRELSMPVAVYRYMDHVCIDIAYGPHIANDERTLATEVVRYIAAVGTGYPPPLVFNQEPEGPQRFLEMCIRCVGTATVISFFNKVANGWIKKGSTVQVRLPSASSMVSGTTQQTRACGTIRRMLGCGLQQVEMARAITEL